MKPIKAAIPQDFARLGKLFFQFKKRIKPTSGIKKLKIA